MTKLFIGLLSGTSMDAIDATLVAFENDYPQLLSTLSYPIPAQFKQQCLEIVQQGTGTIDDLGCLDVKAGELFSEAVLKLLQESKLLSHQITAIGSHGQTLRHRPNANPPFTLQIGDPNIIAERTQIPTIADFRRRDIAAGGQGAPLAPAFHSAVFGSKSEDRVIVNIGGVANISILPKNSAIPISGFDTGPGNCLLDMLSKQYWNTSFDRDGKNAVLSPPNPELLDLCLADTYFHLKPPKSTGREYFNLSWLQEKEQSLNINPAPKEKLATALHITVHSISQAIKKYAPDKSQVFVCGGGAHNIELMNLLEKNLEGDVLTTDTLGFPVDWIEGLLFAWLAKQTLEGKTGNCPSVTGARSAIQLGGIFGLKSSIPMAS